MSRLFITGKSRYALICTPFLLSVTSPLYAADPDAPRENIAVSIDSNEQQRQQERERAQRIQNTPNVDIRLKRADSALPAYPLNETPCFI